jgi:hypothetical protein
MVNATRYFAVLVAATFLFAGAIVSPATGQEKAKDAKGQPSAKAEKGGPKRTALMDNAKVQVFEIQYKPGEENKAVPSASSRVVRALKGGTLMRNYADGKTEKVEWKTGQVRFLEGDKTAYTAKNVGKSDVHLYVVVLK